MSAAKRPTPEEQAACAQRARDYLELIDSEILAWRTAAMTRMADAVVADQGWAGNNDVEYAVARITNLIMMRTVAEGVSDAFAMKDMMNGPPDTRA